MADMNLIYLITGVVLGLGGSRLLRSDKEPVTSMPTQSQKPESQDTQPLEQSDPPQSSQLQGSTSEESDRLKEELEQTRLAYQMATQMCQFKAGFLGRASHELRAPLSSLMGLHQLILTDLCDSPTEEREFVAQANACAAKMVKLLDEVVTVSKTEHGTSRLETRSVPLVEVFDNLHSLTHLQAANRNLQLEVVKPDPTLHVLADQRRLRQVLVSLVDSAIAQMEDGRIKVSANSVPEFEAVHIEIEVRSSNPVWNEPVDLLSEDPNSEAKPDETHKASPGLNLLMAQTLLEVMQGHLTLLPISEEERHQHPEEHLIRLQCSIPVGTPETEEPALA